jgi:hypothetical protein
LDYAELIIFILVHVCVRKKGGAANAGAEPLGVLTAGEALKDGVIDLGEPLEEIMTLLSYRVDKNGSRGVRDFTTIIRGAQDA